MLLCAKDQIYFGYRKVSIDCRLYGMVQKAENCNPRESRTQWICGAVRKKIFWTTSIRKIFLPINFMNNPIC